MVVHLHVLHLLLVPLLAPSLGALASELHETDLTPHLGKQHPSSWPLLFRLGSGAGYEVIGSPHMPRTGSKPFDLMSPKAYHKEYIPGPKPKEKRVMVDSRLTEAITYVLPALSILIVCYMMQGAGQQGLAPARDFNYRIPPAWSPDMEHTYSFRAYMTDISIWVMLTDLLPHQQAAAIVMRLGGAAREMARMITPQELTVGGIRNGVQMDPVTYLLAGIHARFAALEEESRLSCMTEMLAFQRKPHESINALLARYEIVRQRAAIEGQFFMNNEGCSLQLLRACNVQPNQLYNLLQPFGQRLPRTDAEFNQMVTQLRRHGRISENAPGNVARALQGQFQQARPGSYYTGADPTQLQQASSGSQHTYFWGPLTTSSWYPLE